MKENENELYDPNKCSLEIIAELQSDFVPFVLDCIIVVMVTVFQER